MPLPAWGNNASLADMIEARGRVKRIETKAVVVRASGAVEDLGTIALWQRRNPWLWALAALGFVALAVALHNGMVALLGASLVVNTGRAIATNLISGIGGTVPKFLAWGTGAGTTGATDTTLFTEGPEARATCTVTQQTVTTTNDTYQAVGTITASGSRTVTNAGLFDVVTASSGNLYAKTDFTGIVLLTGDSIQFTMKITYS